MNASLFRGFVITAISLWTAYSPAQDEPVSESLPPADATSGEKAAPPAGEAAKMPDIAGNWQVVSRQPTNAPHPIRQFNKVGLEWYMTLTELQMMVRLKWQPKEQEIQLELPIEDIFIPYRLTYAPKNDEMTLAPIMDEPVRQKLAAQVDLPDESAEALQKHFTQTLTRIVSDRVQGGDFLIVETKEGLDGYSETTGTWDRIKIGLPKEGASRLKSLTASQHFATVVIKDQLLGYSSQAGKWGRLTIPPEFVGKVFPTHSQNLVTAKIGENVYALSPKTGEWLSPDGKVVSTSNEANADPEMPDISGVWQRQDSTNKEYVYRAPAGSPHQFLNYYQYNRTPGQLTWLPKQKMFEVTYPSESLQSKVLWQPLPDQKKIQVYRIHLNATDDWASVLDQIANSEIDLKDDKGVVWYELNYFAPYDKIEGATLVLAETEDGFAAFSKTLGRWDRIRVPLPKDGSPRILHSSVGKSFAAGVIDDQLLGYGSEHGRWGRMTIPPEYVGKVEQVIGQDLLSAQVGDTLYAFSPQTGQWLSPDGKPVGTSEASPGAGDSGERQIKIFTLQNAWAVESLPVLTRLFPTANIAEDARTNSIIVTSSDEKEMAEIEAILLRLDESKEKGAVRIRRPATTETSPPRIRLPNTPAAQHLAAEIARHEAEAVELAKQIRNRSLNVGDKHPEQVEVRQKLQNALAKALDLKFQLEQLQVQELQSRLSRLEQQIGQRKAQRQKIIDRRAQELIEGEATKWDSEPAGSGSDENLRSRETSRATSVGETSAPARHQIVVDLYAGDQIYANHNLIGAVVQPLNKLPDVIANILIAGEGNHFVMAIIHDPAQRTRRESELRTAIQSALEAGGIVSMRWEENSEEVKADSVDELTPQSQQSRAADRDVTSVTNTDVPIPPNRTRVRFIGPKGMRIQMADEPTSLSAPANYDFLRDAGKPRNYLLNFTLLPWFQTVIPANLQIYPAEQQTQSYLTRLEIPMRITTEDLDQLVSGNHLTKVVYLPDANFQELALAKVETIASTKLDPGVDPIREADRRGTIVAVLRFDRPRSPSPSSPDAANASREPMGPLASKEFAPDWTTGLVDAQNAVADAKSDLDRMEQLAKKGVVTEQDISKARRDYEAAVRRQQVLHEVYLSTLRDLELQIESAKLEFEAAEVTFQSIDKLGDQISVRKRLEAGLQRNQARISLERLQNRKKLYERAGEGLSTTPRQEERPIQRKAPAVPAEAAPSTN